MGPIINLQTFTKENTARERNNVTNLINSLPGNSAVNTVQHIKIEKTVFSVGPTDAPIDWLDSDHVMCVYCRSMSVPLLYKLYKLRVTRATRVEAGSNTSTVTLRVAGGDEKEVSNLRQ
jgi:hypothetical protein